ncbi:MAG: L7Ae/L30e/S12e/Gadd45 family ribosomal protein [Clostridia bacterium]
MDRLLGTVGLAMRAGKVKTGAYMVERAVLGGTAKAVVAAEDIGESNRRKIEAACENAGVPLIYHSTAAELSRSVGKKDVPVVCICDESFAVAVKKNK